MSSLIEQAAHRLAQLRQAGVEIPEAATAVATPPTLSPAVERPGATGASRTAEASVVAGSRRVEIDLASLEAVGIFTPHSERTRIADEYRVIKRPLILNAVSRGAAALTHGNLIMITSAMPGEGKSFTALNLAMSIAAEMDHTVMLVDADVARPSILRMLGLPPSPGLLDLLEGKAEMSEVLLKTNVDKLTVLPSGNSHPRATELLASVAMRQLLNDMSKRYPDRIIIFDSPPLLLTTESRVLATQMGQVVVVVQANKTLQADVQHALATIESCPVKMMLLNMMPANAKGGYGYAYGYGSYHKPRAA
jgi:exopolysaccharide/PEP-CTERM locus tyrosine autokinase